LNVERLLKIDISQKTARHLRRSLLRWYWKNGRDLPWRRTRDPYAILVSELMLQQTQVGSVLPRYDRWLRRFPDFASLARASENDVLHAWQGLGYYARARNLHAAARIVQDQHGGNLPRNIDAMLDLPGIGRYTGHAVATFAFDQSVPIVETNTARVLARLFNLRMPIYSAAGREKLWRLAAELVPRRKAGQFNSALVDLGALVCLSRNPRCGICPVKKFCRAKNPQSLPVRKSQPQLKRLVEDHAFLVRQKRVLLEQSAARWRKMWILPPIKFDRSYRSSLSRPAYSSVFPFTRHRVTLRVFRKRPAKIENQQRRWFSTQALDSIPIPSPHRRAIVDLLNGARARARRQRSLGIVIGIPNRA
jgi:A/G-specific adenine glycosylase